MASRRMFSPEIVCSEEFLEMPPSTRELYFQLGMRADDDGFIQPKSVIRSIGAKEDDLKVLVAKRFVLPFETGVVVIKHWLVHNMIRADRYKPTRFQEEKNMLYLKDNKAYTDNPNNGEPVLATIRQPNGNHPAPQVRLGKVSKIQGTKVPITSLKNPKMKKNRLGSYRETNSEDAYEDVIDIESGEVSSTAPKYSFQENLERLKKSPKKIDKIIGHYWIKKGFSFENEAQAKAQYGLDSAYAKSLKGYSGEQLDEVMNACEKEGKEAGYDWTLSTVVKKAARVIYAQ